MDCKTRKRDKYKLGKSIYASHGLPHHFIPAMFVKTNIDKNRGSVDVNIYTALTEFLFWVIIHNPILGDNSQYLPI